ncbi:hypothetical protein [Actinophytocola sp. NPDC049390]|uniref:hypothetical protein n=1 Tax=Actinophytocola sp. NPDC049390 TaxID=3363894 RepID=UPI0037A33DE2
MTATRLATVGDVIAVLSGYDPTTPVRIAGQPHHPMEHHLARVVCTPDDAEGDGTPRIDPPVVWSAWVSRSATFPRPPPTLSDGRDDHDPSRTRRPALVDQPSSRSRGARRSANRTVS